MQLEGPWLSTINTKKRGEKLTKAKREELEGVWRERNKMMKRNGIPTETFDEFIGWVYGRGEKSKPSREPLSIKNTTPRVVNQTANINPPKSDTHGNHWVTGTCSTKKIPEYTGTKMLGIGTMHKSNGVPIFSDEEAKQISTMRR